MNQDLDYTFPSHPASHTPLHRLQNSAAIHATHHSNNVIRISIPLDVFSYAGTVTFSAQRPAAFTWLSQNPWNPAMNHVPLVDASVRKGGTVGMPVETATLDLSTPFLELPTGLWDVLVLATQPGRDADARGLSVECAARERFPDLVFGVRTGDEEDDDESVAELVVTPAQYVLQSEDGKCTLLARAAAHGDESVTLGWAAFRGRPVALDWETSQLGIAM